VRQAIKRLEVRSGSAGIPEGGPLALGIPAGALQSGMPEGAPPGIPQGGPLGMGIPEGGPPEIPQGGPLGMGIPEGEDPAAYVFRIDDMTYDLPGARLRPGQHRVPVSAGGLVTC